MKLYYFPASSSLSSHIVGREAGVEMGLEKVTMAENRTESGADFRAINPKGYVPALELDDGQLLTEAAVIAQYLAERKPEAKLLPPQGTMERYRVLEWLNYIASELHKPFNALFNPKMPDDLRQATVADVSAKFDLINQHLDGRDYLVGDGFTVADAYLFTVLNWPPFLKWDMSRWPAFAGYSARIAARPAVQTALREEGLLQ